MSSPGQARWQQISPYLDSVLSLPDGERDAWLADFRAEEPELADLLKELLDEHVLLQQEEFLAGQAAVPAEASFVGEMIGAYRLISLIGEGGMGTVWLAERSDGRFDRKVAIKFLRFSLCSQTGSERFKREGRILGQLSHPHIAEMIDAGVSTTGQPYIVLEHIDGEPIDVYCDHHLLDVDARIALFLDVLSAVSHAHASLIVHRDIKPSNVLVRNDGQVKLLDFGIAKLLAEDAKDLAETQLTLNGGAALTPQYAAPEQVTGDPVTTATDVYGLGNLLYLLLTGKHAAGEASQSPAELVKSIVDAEPVRASDASISGDPAVIAQARGTSPEKLRRQLRGDLDTIVAKSLKKIPAERYGTVTAFAEDLERVLNHEPISARPDSLAYSAAKFVRRNRVVVALVSVAVLALLAGGIGTLVQARRARAQRDFAFRQLARAEASNDLISFVLSDAAPSGKPFRVNELLGRAEQIVNHQSSGDEQSRVELLISIGRQYANQDENSKAVMVLEQAYKSAQGLTDPSVRAEAACNLADSLARGNEPERAEKLFQQGMREIPTGREFASLRTGCLLAGSEVARDSGDMKTGVARVQQAQSSCLDLLVPNKVLELTVAIDTAEAYRMAGQNREAVAAFEKAAQKLNSLGRENTVNAVALFNGWAYALGKLGRPLEAEKLYERAINISRDGDSYDSVSPMVLGNYAKTLHILGHLKDAAFYSEQACAKAKTSGFEIAVNQLLLERARIYRDQGNYTQSDEMLAEVEPRLRKSLPTGHLAFAVLALEKAQNKASRADLKAAQILADQAVELVEASIKSGGDGSDSLGPFLYKRAAIEFEAGHTSQAIADASRSIKLIQADAEPGTFSVQLAQAYLTLGSALDGNGDHGEARDAFQSAAVHFEKTLGSDHPNAVKARQLASPRAE